MLITNIAESEIITSYIMLDTLDIWNFPPKLITFAIFCLGLKLVI